MNDRTDTRQTLIAPLAATIRELEGLHLGADVPPEAVECARRLVERPLKLLRVVPQVGAAPRTAEPNIKLEPSDLFECLVAAARAGDWRRFMVLEHGDSPSGAAAQ